MTYTIQKHLPDISYADAVGVVREALKKEGFGVLTEIDIQATLKQKLGVDGPRYIILGACNPPLAHQALQADPLIGALLPCNVMVIEDGAGGCQVAAVDPEAMFKLVDKKGVAAIASEVKAKLERVLAKIG